MNAAYSIYMVSCALAVIVVYSAPWLDFRGAGRVLRPRLHSHVAETHRAEEADYDPAAARAERRLARRRRALDRLVIEPRADFSVLLALGGIAAISLGMALGFLGPLTMKALLLAADQPVLSPPSPGAPRDLATTPFAAEEPLGRLAQIVGLVAGAAISLRMLRIFMGAALCVFLAFGALAAANFVIGRPLLALFAV